MTRRLAVAVAFLTRLPVPGAAAADAREVGRAMLLFPAAGALLGLLLAGAHRVMAARLSAPLAAALLLALAALLTGALHLDGLADAADGLGGGRTPGEALRIMRDHAVGAYGASALVLLLLVEAAALAALAPGAEVTRAIVLAWTLSRWAPVPLARFLPYARPGGGLGAAATDHAGSAELWGATAISAAAVAWAGSTGALAAAVAVALLLAFGALCRRRLGGVTGDTLGAAVLLIEAATLVVAAATGGEWP